MDATTQRDWRPLLYFGAAQFLRRRFAGCAPPADVGW
jgi:hypothetical protein